MLPQEAIRNTNEEDNKRMRLLKWMKDQDKFELVLYYYNELARSFMTKRKFESAEKLLNECMKQDGYMEKIH